MPFTENTREVGRIRWFYLLCGVVSLLFAGIIYAWSILKVPLANEFGWSISDLAMNYTFTICFFCIGCLLSGVLLKKFSVQTAIITGGVLVFGGFLIASRMSGGSIGVLYGSYGGMCGLGIGLAYNSIIAAVNAWFPDKKGLCSGLLMMGFGASALVLGNLADILIEMDSFGWRKTYLLLSIAIGAALVVAGLIIRLPAQEVRFPQGKVILNDEGDRELKPRDYTPGEMVKRLSFWRFFIAMTLTGAAGSSVISFARDFAVSVGAAAAAATFFVGILSVFNGLGRIISGLMFDKFGRRVTMVYVGSVTIAALGMNLMAVLMHSAILCVIGFCFIGLSYGGNTTVISVFLLSFYGSKNYAQNLSVGLMTLIPASFIARFSSSLLASTGTSLTPFRMLLVFACISLALLFSIKRP